MTSYLWVANTTGQDYQCIRDTGEQLFTNGAHYRTIKTDSIKEFSDRTVYYSFPVIGSMDPPWECFSDEHPSWIGSHITQYTNGDAYFYNVAGDSLLIKTSASVGEEWMCYSFDTEDYVKGKVISWEEMSFLDQVDSVKTIQFNAVSLAGNPIPNAINGKKIKISKSWGMVQTLNFKLFPDLYDYPGYEEINEYDLCGMTNPETGIQNLTIKRIFDYNVGDEFHIHQSSSSWLQDNYFYYEIHRIMDKQWISDSVIQYNIERCIRRHYLASDTLIMFHDTLISDVNLNSYWDAHLNKVPDKYRSIGSDWGTEYYWYEQQDNPGFNRMSKGFFGGYFNDPEEDCIYPLIDYDYSCHYLEGLGGPYWDYGSFGSNEYRGLVYYKKGEEEWGDPYECDSLLTGILHRNLDGVDLMVAPNPMTSSTTFTFKNPSGELFTLVLFDSFGRAIKSLTTQTDRLVLDKERTLSGIYFYILYKGEHPVTNGKLIIQ